MYRKLKSEKYLIIELNQKSIFPQLKFGGQSIFNYAPRLKLQINITRQLCRMTSQQTLRSTLIAFLKGEEVYYPQLECTILQANPFQISDDRQFYFDSCNLQEMAESEVRASSHKRLKIVLKSWNFVFRRVPSTHDYYFDIQCKDFSLEPSDLNPEGCTETYVKVISDDLVKYHFEVRRRKQIGLFIKNEAPVSVLGEIQVKVEDNSSGKKKATKGRKKAAPKKVNYSKIKFLNRARLQ